MHCSLVFLCLMLKPSQEHQVLERRFHLGNSQLNLSEQHSSEDCRSAQKTPRMKKRLSRVEGRRGVEQLLQRSGKAREINGTVRHASLKEPGLSPCEALKDAPQEPYRSHAWPERGLPPDPPGSDARLPTSNTARLQQWLPRHETAIEASRALVPRPGACWRWRLLLHCPLRA